jgi:hypothetical protein
MRRGSWFALTVCAVGCGGGGTGSTESFLAGLPSRQTLEVTAPNAVAPAALTTGSAEVLGQTADLYVVTRKATADVNGIVGGALETLDTIAHSPPAAVGPDVAAWGPLTAPLSPVAGRLVVQRVGPGAFTFRLDLRPRTAADSAFETFLQGATTGASTSGPGQGSFSADLSLAHRLDPVANPSDGRLVAGWAVGPSERDVRVHLADLQGGSELPSAAELGSVLRGDGSGELSVDVQANLVGDPAVLESGQIRSRWAPSGAGRADVQVHGGDAPDGGQITECWDASFDRVYAQGTTPDGGVASEGDVTACAFSEPLR